MTNLLTRVPRRAQPWVATMVRTIYQQPSPDQVHAQLDRVTDQLQDRFHARSQRMRKRVEEIFGWMKTVGGFRRTRYRGVERTGRRGSPNHISEDGTAYRPLRPTPIPPAFGPFVEELNLRAIDGEDRPSLTTLGED